MCAHVVDKQMGRLLRQVRPWLSAVRRECGRAFQRLDASHFVF